MRRFIHHSELARDSRFIRQDNSQSTVLATLPDDVDAVVEVFEKFAPMIEQSVRGTAAEPLFDAYGPAFGLVILNQPLSPDDPAGKTLSRDRSDFTARSGRPTSPINKVSPVIIPCSSPLSSINK